MIQRMLIVMRLADMHVVHPDQIKRTCSSCGEPVGIYPSGQRVLATAPDTRLICSRCYAPGDADTQLLAPGALQERAESIPREEDRH